MNTAALLIFTVLARREGLSEDRALKYGVSGGLMGLRPLTLIVLYLLIQREAATLLAATGAGPVSPTPPP